MTKWKIIDWMEEFIPTKCSTLSKMEDILLTVRVVDPEEQQE